MCYVKGGTEILGVTNQRVLKPEKHAKRVSISLTQSRAPGPKVWMAQGLRIEPGGEKSM